MKTTSLNEALPELILIEPRRYVDDRGHFHEAFNESRYEKVVGPIRFVQDNISTSTRGVVRGLHFQKPRGQAKLVQVLSGAVFDVAVDIRVGSPTFGKWAGVVLDANNSAQLFIPEGFAHGFVALTYDAVFHYKCSEYYSPANERSVLWDDPDIGIEWPLDHLKHNWPPLVSVSAKDAAAKRLKDIPEALLPNYEYLRQEKRTPK